jgi:hypothetical protein
MAHRRKASFAIAAATITAAAILGGNARESSAETQPVPGWFAGIAAYYGNDPRLTPEFDFASLYDGDYLQLPYPDWFAGIAAYYGNDPRLTPEFDFAAAYSGDLAEQP